MARATTTPSTFQDSVMYPHLIRASHAENCSHRGAKKSAAAWPSSSYAFPRSAFKNKRAGSSSVEEDPARRKQPLLTRQPRVVSGIERSLQYQNVKRATN